MRRVLLGLLTTALAACSGGESAPGEGAPREATSGSGLQITHVTRGSGASPKPTDVVRVHYHGTFADGEVFDSSVQRGEPARFPLDRVIPCWTEGLQQIQVVGDTVPQPLDVPGARFVLRELEGVVLEAAPGVGAQLAGIVVLAERQLSAPRPRPRLGLVHGSLPLSRLARAHDKRGPGRLTIRDRQLD